MYYELDFELNKPDRWYVFSSEKEINDLLNGIEVYRKKSYSLEDIIAYIFDEDYNLIHIIDKNGVKDL